MIENLKELKLVSGEITLTYSGKTAEGETVVLTDDVSADPRWIALLQRYVRHHAAVGVNMAGSKEISLRGSAGEFPTVEPNRYMPGTAFIG